ncbi:MAG: bifunctional DNA-formamidopyrimidine glycosylase/DNA-(apurinic or apyrimidinic site) lyase [Gemmatimonadales bacterium]
MPELPEVETMVRGVRPRLEGATIVGASLTHTDVLRGVSRPRLVAALTGAFVDRVTRRAKHGILHLVLASGERRWFVLQPGMTGNLLVYDDTLTSAEAKYAVLRARLDRGGEFVFRDIRRIGALLLLDAAGWARYDRALGPEPLDPALTAAAFIAQLRPSRAAIKKVLMDQRRIVGVGNIYANEALYCAGIDPSKPAHLVTPEAYHRLYQHVRRILQAAIEAEGTTFRDYRTGTGQPGNFQLELMVYEREGEPCRACGTTLAGTHAIDARITVFCHRCQR